MYALIYALLRLWMKGLEIFLKVLLEACGMVEYPMPPCEFCFRNCLKSPYSTAIAAFRLRLRPSSSTYFSQVRLRCPSLP